MIFIWIAMNDSCQGWCVKTLGSAVTPCQAALMHSQTPTWLNSINPQRSLAIFAPMLAPLLHLVLQRHHCVMVAYERGWTLTGLRPQDFNHSSTAGIRLAVRGRGRGERRRSGETDWEVIYILAPQTGLIDGGCRRRRSAAAWLLNSETPLHARTLHTPQP